MSNFDRDEDWASHLQEKGRERAHREVSNIREINRAALAAAHVTGDKHWDMFLEMVNDRLVKKRESLEDFRNKMEESNDFSTEGLINQKLAVRQLGCEIEALEWVIGLPKSIMEQSDKAKKLLGTVDETAH